MFNVDFLHVIREFEYKKIIERIKPGARVLEIGGGTGYQARRLAEDGYVVESIDIPDSTYAGQHEFLVQPYDGKNIPFPNESFDVVFSSNVLEHVTDLPYLQNEFRRVLRPGGVCVHVMPTGAWRFWTNVAHYVELFQRLLALAPRLIPRGLSRHDLRDVLSVLRLMMSMVRHYAIVPRHGEKGNAVSEIFTFSTYSWLKHFENENFIIEGHEPVGLFYTGHMVLGAVLSVRLREVLSKCLGSACVIYVVKSR